MFVLAFLLLGQSSVQALSLGEKLNPIRKIVRQQGARCCPSPGWPKTRCSQTKIIRLIQSTHNEREKKNIRGLR